MRLSGRVALVTGSTTGIGEAIAVRLAREGARVLVHGLERDDGARVVARIVAESPGAAVYHGAELADAGACAELVAAAVAAFGGLDILVNNAAVKTRDHLDSVDLAGFERTIAVNLRAPLLLIKAAMPHFRRLGGGAVVNIGSINGECGEAHQLSYSLAKGALATLARNLANAHGHEGVRFNHFNVGWVLTANELALKVREGLPADWPRRLPALVAPCGRLITPDEIAHYVLAYVDGDGAAINGSVVDLEQYPMASLPRISYHLASLAHRAVEASPAR